MFSSCRERWAWPWAVLAPHTVPGLVQAETVHRALLRHLCDLATISTAAPISGNPFPTLSQQQWLFSLLPLLCHGHLIDFALWCACKQSSVPCFADTFACDFQVPKSTRGGWQFTGLQLMLTLPPKSQPPRARDSEWKIGSVGSEASAGRPSLWLSVKPPLVSGKQRSQSKIKMSHYHIKTVLMNSWPIMPVIP